METPDTEFKNYAAKHIVTGIVLAAAIVWLSTWALGSFTQPASDAQHPFTAAPEEGHAPAETASTAHGPDNPEPAATADKSRSEHNATPPAPTAGTEGAHSSAAAEHATALMEKPRGPAGVAFVEAAMKPMHYELEERFFGWRPNDIIQFGDNVRNYQLGVLEVTRRTAVMLAERLSRTGSTQAFDVDLERAMNWFMIKADRYWLPSAESKYSDGLDELQRYQQKVRNGEASFYTRADNLIPLLSAYEDLLGSCDENLVKHTEEDGSPVSSFKADNYFFYAKGVASAMLPILEAVMVDFQATLNARNCIEVLHHAIISCRRATEIDPFIVTEGSLGGLLANHRANIAATVSHARFYIGVLIKTLST